MEGKVSDGKAIKLMDNLWKQSTWRDSLFCLAADEIIDDSFLTLPRNSKVSSIKQHLDGYSEADKLVFQCLADTLPMKYESKYILNYLLARLNRDFAHIQLKTQGAQNKMLANVVQSLDSNKLVVEWMQEKKAKELKLEIEHKILEIQNRANADVKANWIDKYLEMKKQRNNYKQMLDRCLRSVYENKFYKASFNCIYEKFIDMRCSFNKIACKIFMGQNPRMKKWTNMYLRKIKKIDEYIKGKLFGFTYQEELNLLQKYNLEDQGLLWASLAREEMKKNETIEKLYQSLDLQKKYQAMKIITKDTQKLHNIHEIKLQIEANINSGLKLLTSSTNSSTLNINLSAIKDSEEEWEEIEEDELEEQNNYQKVSNYKKIFSKPKDQSNTQK